MAATNRFPVAAALAMFLLAAPGPAHAMSGFQDLVVQYYGLPGVLVDPPNGCKLCHVNETGNLPMSRFGTLLVSLGANATNPASIDGALAQLDAQYPAISNELRQGIDPNNPPVASVSSDGGVTGAPAVALPGPAGPTPSYGCECGVGARSSAPGPATLAAVGAALLVGRRRRARRGGSGRIGAA
jgi:MYXO-CTERM domain-containing protein